MPESGFIHKDSPDKCLERLREGNLRFSRGESIYPNLTPERVREAGISDQSEHAFATVLSCSDSRVPVEILFDVGIMDIFVIRVAGNVCSSDTLASVEFGLSYVNTPVLLVLGHTKCGAVSAVTRIMQGRSRIQEQHIPGLLEYIQPAVNQVRETHPELEGDDIIFPAIERNVCHSIQELYKNSMVVRRLHEMGYVKLAGAVYDLESGLINWLPDDRINTIISACDL